MTECHDEVALLDKATCRERQPAEVALAIEDPPLCLERRTICQKAGRSSRPKKTRAPIREQDRGLGRSAPDGEASGARGVCALARPMLKRARRCRAGRLAFSLPSPSWASRPCPGSPR